MGFVWFCDNYILDFCVFEYNWIIGQSHTQLTVDTNSCLFTLEFECILHRIGKKRMNLTAHFSQIWTSTPKFYVQILCLKLMCDFYCEAQARVRQGRARKGKGGQSRRKASKLKPLPRAYIKVGCHPPPLPPPTHKFNFTQLMVRQWLGEVGGGKRRCVGSLWATLGSL